MLSSGMLSRLALVTTDVSGYVSPPRVLHLLLTANVVLSSMIHVTLMTEEIRFSET
jgi:hypothetical protein